jgi:septal ring factor EnvC (AmiA/AmiB activator)
MESEKFIYEWARANGGLCSLLLVILFFVFKGLAKVVDFLFRDFKDRLTTLETKLDECEKKHETSTEEARKLYKELTRLTGEMATYRGQLDIIEKMAVAKSTADKVAGAALLKSLKENPDELKNLLKEIERDDPGS